MDEPVIANVIGEGRFGDADDILPDVLFLFLHDLLSIDRISGCADGILWRKGVRFIFYLYFLVASPVIYDKGLVRLVSLLHRPFQFTV